MTTVVDKGLARFDFRTSRRHQKHPPPALRATPAGRGTQHGKNLFEGHASTDPVRVTMTYQDFFKAPVMCPPLAEVARSDGGGQIARSC